jgi:hypothetical protein
MDPYATDVYLCKQIYIYRMSIDLWSNILIKFIASSYDLSHKKCENIKSIKVLIPQFILMLYEYICVWCSHGSDYEKYSSLGCNDE